MFPMPGRVDVPIQLSWSQALAAYWAVAWPSWIVTKFMLFFLISHGMRDGVGGAFVVLGVLFNFAFFAGQFLLVPRLIRKTFRSFFVGIVAEDGTVRRAPAYSEVVSIAFRLVLPQAIFWLLLSVILYWITIKSGASVAKPLDDLARYAQILIVGPYAVGRAVNIAYPRFRLQAYAR
jgi:hypothetical protein